MMQSIALQRKLVITAIILITLIGLLLLVNNYLLDLSSIVFGCVDKAFQNDLPLRHVYTLSDIAEVAQRNHIPVNVQTITYANLPANTPLTPQLQQLLGQDGFVVEETANGVKRVSGYGLLLRYPDGPATYEMLIRYQPDADYKQAIENIRIEGGCVVPNIRIRARLRDMLGQLGVENEMIDQAQIITFSDFLDWNLP